MQTESTARFGGTDMVGRLRRVLLRRPDARACARWREFGWRAPPDPKSLAAEHDELCELLSVHGAEVAFGTPSPELLDAVYTFDAAIVGPHGAIVLRSGKALRQAEAALTTADLRSAGVTVAAELAGPATADGGDTIWLDERTLLVGRGYRTNAAGAAALRAALPDVDVIEFDLPYFHGDGEVMHLLSLLSPLASDLVVGYLPLMPVRLVQLLAERGIRIVEVPDDEFDTMGPNVLALEPRVALALEHNRETRRRLEQAGVEVLTYAGKELSKGDGGPTCLTRPLLRD
jgi:N-dimethylarginine dimethylaminohydrolase